MINACICCGIGEVLFGTLFLLGLAGCPIATKWINYIKYKRGEVRQNKAKKSDKCQCECCEHERK